MATTVEQAQANYRKVVRECGANSMEAKLAKSDIAIAKRQAAAGK